MKYHNSFAVPPSITFGKSAITTGCHEIKHWIVHLFHTKILSLRIRQNSMLCIRISWNTSTYCDNSYCFWKLTSFCKGKIKLNSFFWSAAWNFTFREISLSNFVEGWRSSLPRFTRTHVPITTAWIRTLHKYFRFWVLHRFRLPEHSQICQTTPCWSGSRVRLPWSFACCSESNGSAVPVLQKLRKWLRGKWVPPPWPRRQFNLSIHPRIRW